MISTTESRLPLHEPQTHSFAVNEAAAHRFSYWPVCWSAVAVGALASLAALVVLGLVGTALGFHLTGPENRVVDLRKVGMITLAFSVFAAFLSYVCGGWVAGKIGGICRSEPAMLHGAITWLATIPLLMLLVSLGAGSYLGSWHGGLAGTPSWASSSLTPFERPVPPDPMASPEERSQYAQDRAEYNSHVKQWREDTPRATRNAALGAVTALLLGLMGSVIGGWMASDEPMSLTYHRTRNDVLVH